MALEREKPRETPAALRRPRLGVVIGSGSIKCVSALGFLRVLRREQIPVDLAVGCSAGGMVKQLPFLKRLLAAPDGN